MMADDPSKARCGLTGTGRRRSGALQIPRKGGVTLLVDKIGQKLYRWGIRPHEHDDRPLDGIDGREEFIARGSASSLESAKRAAEESLESAKRAAEEAEKHA